MIYDSREDIDRLYKQIADMFEIQDQPWEAMALSDALIDKGEEDSWASVWWAYGAIHTILSDEACERALDLLTKVDRSEPARAAALMLTAEIEFTSALQSGHELDPERQLQLLAQAVELAPRWPALRLRIADALRALGRNSEACRSATLAAEWIEQHRGNLDPYDTAITGFGLIPELVRERSRQICEP